MARRRTIRKRTTKRGRTTKRSSGKRKLAGFTKTGGKFALVFRRNKKLSIGAGRFKTKKSLLMAASKFRR